MLGWLSAATGAAFMIGPATGSLTWRLGHAAPGLVAAGLCLTNPAFGLKSLPEPTRLRANGRSRLAVPPLEEVG